MKFYMSPGSCSTGIHILLEELELIYEVHIVNLPNREHLSSDFIAINAKASIPVLLTDEGLVITEFLAIAYWLAQSHPKHNLLPEDIERASKTLELISFVVDTIHGKGFSRLFVTEEYSIATEHRSQVQKKGRDIIDKAFSVIDPQLDKREYFNTSFSIADAALFYVEFWAHSTDIALPPNCEQHYQTMLTRQTVRNVLMEEGYHLYTAEYQKG